MALGTTLPPYGLGIAYDFANDQPQGGIINRPRTPRRDDIGFGWGGWVFNNTPGRGGQYYDPRNNNRNSNQRPQRWW